MQVQQTTLSADYAARAKLLLAVVKISRLFNEDLGPRHAATASLTPSKPVAPYF
jgi:hypothetical protein